MNNRLSFPTLSKGS